MPLIHAIDHINLVVSDLERSVKFYTEVLGFRVTRRARLKGDWIESIIGLKGINATGVYIVAPVGEPRLELLCFDNPREDAVSANSMATTIGVRHIALRVEDIQKAVKRLKEAGVKIISEPVVVPATVITHDAGHKILCYFHDPDGILLELAEYR